MAKSIAKAEVQKQILFASRYAYMYYQSVSEAFQDYSLSFTQNAKQAINYLQRNKPSVVILSENLNELDTLKLCKAIRKSSRLTATKIILLVSDEKKLDNIDKERIDNVDIILKQSQKPASFITHIGKLLKASEAIEAELYSSATNIGNAKKEKTLGNITSQNSSESDQGTHLTPFPEATEHIYLFQDSELAEKQPRKQISSVTVESSKAPQAESKPKSKSELKPDLQPLHPLTFQKNTPEAPLETIGSRLEAIRPPQSPSNKPVYKQTRVVTPQDQAIYNEKVELSEQTSQHLEQDFAQTKKFSFTSDESDNYDNTNMDSILVAEQANVTEQATTSTIPKVADADTKTTVPLSFEPLPNPSFDYGESTEVKTIAIIEDNASIAFLEKSILERQGYNTFHIADAPQARDFVDTNFDMADLILLDLNLPGGSGFEILRRIRSFSRKPVIIVSGLKQSENIKRGLSLGAQDYLTKPMNPQELILRVSQHIKNFA